MTNVEQLLSAAINRRRLLEIGGATVVAGVAARFLPQVVAAQAATEATLGYPAITVTVSDNAIAGPVTFPAGLTHVTVKNTQQNGLEHMIWGKFPDGLGKEDVMNMLATPPPATPPAEDPLATQILARLTIVGGPDEAMPGRDAVGIIPFTEGHYMLLNVFGEQPPFFFDVTAPDPQAKTDEPTADITVQLGNMVFVGLDNGVPAGKHIWKVENIDKIFHEMALIPIDVAWTEDDFINFMKTSSEDDANALFLTMKGASSIQTPGIISWQLFDLPAGHYAAACFAPMSWTEDMPHALMGMVKVFDAK